MLKLSFWIKFITIKFLILEIRSQSIENNRMIGGKVAEVESWEFIATILSGRYGFCAGSLIRPKWILTAAHCVKGQRYDFVTDLFGDLSVRIGPERLEQEPIQQVVKPEKSHLFFNETNRLVGVANQASIREIDKIFAHPDFQMIIQGVETEKKPEKRLIPTEKSYAVSNDIALIKLKMEMKDKKISLPTKSVYKTISCRSADWYHGPNEQNILKDQAILILNAEKCEEILTTVAKEKDISVSILTHQKLCFQSYYQNNSILQAGAPLICDGELHGLGNLAIIQYPGYNIRIYTSIFIHLVNYIEWIDQVFQNNGEKPIPPEVLRSKSFPLEKSFILIFFCTSLIIIF